MATFKTFEDITAWRKAREMTRNIYTVSQQPPFAKDFGLRDQIRKTGISIMANIAEGFERSGTAEFVQFLSNAKGSCGEVRSQLYVALDQGYLMTPQFKDLHDLSTETSRTISGLMSYLIGSELRGSKFK